MTRRTSTTTTKTTKSTCLVWMRRSVEFKSLEDVWYTLLSVCLQIVCIWRAFERIRKYANETWEPFERPVVQLGVYVVCAVMSVCLLPVMIWSGLVRVGTYANDRFRFGHDLDTKRIGKREFSRAPRFSPCRRRDERPKSMSFLPASKQGNGLKRYNSAIDSFVATESSSSGGVGVGVGGGEHGQQHINKFDYFSDTASSSGCVNGGGRSDRRRVMSSTVGQHHHVSRVSVFERLRAVVDVKLKWRNLMPISSLVHLIIAMCLLFPNVLLVAKQIQYGLRPKGKIP